MPKTQIADNCYYTKKHEWLCPHDLERGSYRMGISDYAQHALGDIVYVDINCVENSPVQSETSLGVIESVKAVEDLYSPISGTIVAINSAIQEKPELLNQKAYEAWIVEIKIANQDDLKGLMDAKAYSAYTENLP